MELDIKITESLETNTKQPLAIDGIIIRSISQILIDADKTTELKVLSDCWKEVVKNKKQYPLVQLLFAREHLENLSREMARKDIEENKEFFDMWNDIFNGL